MPEFTNPFSIKAKVDTGDNKGGFRVKEEKKEEGPKEPEHITRARDFLDAHESSVLNTFLSGIYTKVKYTVEPGTGFYYTPNDDTVHIGAGWLRDKRYSLEQFLWATLHELSHFKDKVQNPGAFLDNFEGIREKAMEYITPNLEEKYAEAVGTESAKYKYLTKKRKPRKKDSFQVWMSRLDAVAYKKLARFYNILDDIYVNHYVQARAGLYENKGGGKNPHTEHLYKDILFARSDVSTLPRHLSFDMLLRGEMVNEDTVVHPEMKEVFDNFSWNGVSLEGFIDFLKGETDPEKRYNWIRSTELEDMFIDALIQDIEEWEYEEPQTQENQNGEGEEGDDGENQEGDEGQEGDGNEGDPFADVTPDIHAGDGEKQDDGQEGGEGDSKEDGGEENNNSSGSNEDGDSDNKQGSDSSKGDDENGKSDNKEGDDDTGNNQQQKADGQEGSPYGKNADPFDEINKFFDEYDEVKKAHERRNESREERHTRKQHEQEQKAYTDMGLTPEQVKLLEEQLQAIQEARQKMYTNVWEPLIQGVERGVRKIKKYRKSGDNVSVSQVVRNFSRIQQGDTEVPVFEHTVLTTEDGKQYIDNLFVRVLTDISGSTSGKRLHSIQQTLLLLTESLADYMQSKRFKSELPGAYTQVRYFDDRTGVAKEFNEQMTAEKRAKMFKHFAASRGGTDAPRALDEVIADIPLEQVQNIRDGKHREILFVITDGDIGESAEKVKNLQQKGLIVFGVYIGDSEDEEKHVQEVFGEQYTIQLPDGVESLPQALMQKLTRLLL